MSPETGRRFGPYEIQSRLGGGGMGHVYRAWDARLHREVAIKLLQNDYAMPGMRERFLREARAASALNHPNICTIFDIGEQNGDPYLVMELLEGETLRDRIRSHTMTTEEMACVGKEVADALGAAHAKGVIHRDVKPANIFLVNRPGGTVQAKVLDFGLAKIEGGVLGARGSRSMDITSVGSTVGTLAYMSPEQARGEMLDSRSDLFSLGVVMYEMATRHVPFQGATSALVFVKLLNHPPEPVREWNETVPRDLERIINKLLAKERTARYQTAQELMTALGQMNEKGSTGPARWLRKAVGGNPLGRTAEAAARNERAADEGQAGDAGGLAALTPRPQYDKVSSELPLFLRPVARVPRGDGSSRPSSRMPSEQPDLATGDLSASLAAQTNPADQPAAASPAAEASVSNPVAVSAPNQPARPEGVPAPSTAVHVPPLSPIRPPRERNEQSQLAAAAVLLPPLSASSERTASSSSETTVSDGARSGRISRAVPAIPSDPLFDEEPDPAPEKRLLTPMRVGLGLAAVLLVLGGGILALNRGHLHPTMLTEQDTVLLTTIENRTGNSLLDGTVATGLEIALRQSPYLRLEGEQSYLAALHTVSPDGTLSTSAGAREAARLTSVSAYLIGSVKGTSAPYTLHVDLVNTASNDVMSSVEEPVTSLSEIAGAIDRVANDLRSNAGEDDDSITRNNVPLAREATANVEALHYLSLGDAALVQGRMLDALKAYQDATRLEPRFVQSLLRQVLICRRERAELSAAEAARQALSAADASSERLRMLAQFEYEVNSSHDFVRATAIVRHFLIAAPHDSEMLEALARSLRLQGRMSEALQAAQQSYAEDPYNGEAYRQAQDALISLDRYDAAYQLEAQAEHLGVSRIGGTLIAAYLEGRPEGVASAVGAFEARKASYAPDWTYGIYLDNGGRMNVADGLWRMRAAQARQLPGLESAAGYLLAQGALDRALAGECGPALSLAQASAEEEQGATTLFNEGMADALCGDVPAANAAMAQLTRGWPQGFDVLNFYVPDLKAALALHDNDPVTALRELSQARQFDLLSLTPWLRGRAHVQLRQVQIGIVDFQTVLAHRGSTFTIGTNVYPVAEIGVARAFADTGDMNNSAESYRRFLDLWKNADAGQPLVTEARQHVH